VTRRLTLITRHGCHLCEDMYRQLEQLREELGFELELVDVDSDEALVRAHGTQVPVIMLAGSIICHYFLDEVALRAALKHNN